MSTIDRPASRRATLHARLHRACAAVLLVALGACGAGSETEQLAELRDGLIYTQYRRASQTGMPAAVEAYRKGAQWTGAGAPPEFNAKDHCTMHVLLAYGALVADKNTIALAESDIVDGAGCDDFDRVAAGSLRAVVFQRLDWPGLAKTESDRIWATPTLPGETRGPVAQVMTLHVALAYLAVNEKQWNRAQIHIDALAQLLKQPWMSDLPRAGIAFQEGRTGDALAALKHMSQDPTAPPAVRKELARLIAQIEDKGGPVDSFAFMPRLVAVLTWEAIKQQGPEVIKTTARFAEHQAWKPLNDSMQDGVGKARDVAGSWWSKARDAVKPAEQASKYEQKQDENGKAN